MNLKKKCIVKNLKEVIEGLQKIGAVSGDHCLVACDVKSSFSNSPAKRRSKRIAEENETISEIFM